LVAAGLDGQARIWDLSELESGSISLPTLFAHPRNLGGVSFHPDGLLFATAGWDGIVRLWDIENNTLPLIEHPDHDDRVNAVTFSNDGRFLASGGSDGFINVWNMENLDELPVATIDAHKAGVEGLVFHPFQPILASASPDQTVGLWEVPSGKRIATLRGHTSEVKGLAFNSDGSLLASSGGDRTIRLWDMGNFSADPIVLDGHNNRVISLFFDSGTGRLFSGSADKTVRTWVTDPETLFKVACDRLSRNLSPEEWERYIGDTIDYRITCQ
jgi:WD40 repeat protein